MKLSMLALGAALSFHVALAPAYAQNKNDHKDDHTKNAPAAQDPADMMAQYEAMSQPGPEHKLLQPFVGEWDVKARFWMEPQGEAMESTGKAKTEWILDGRYQRQNYTGQFMGKEFKGEGLMGYNKVTGEYFSTWIDSMSTGMGLGHGSVSADGKTFTFSTEYDDPMTEGKMNTREVLKVLNNNEFVVTSYMRTDDGGEFKHMELRYSRTK